MYSEHLAIILLMASTHLSGPQAKAPAGPVVEDARHALIRAVKEPELMAALSLRSKRMDMRKPQAVSTHTLLASAQ